jgi:hypothetical protein
MANQEESVRQSCPQLLSENSVERGECAVMVVVIDPKNHFEQGF